MQKHLVFFLHLVVQTHVSRLETVPVPLEPLHYVPPQALSGNTVKQKGETDVTNSNI